MKMTENLAWTGARNAIVRRRHSVRAIRKKITFYLSKQAKTFKLPPPMLSLANNGDLMPQKPAYIVLGKNVSKEELLNYFENAGNLP